MSRPCPRCEAPDSEARYDRHGIYSGRACDRCAKELPGQGAMWDYEADEPIEAEDDGLPSKANNSPWAWGHE